MDYVCIVKSQNSDEGAFVTSVFGLPWPKIKAGPIRLLDEIDYYFPAKMPDHPNSRSPVKPNNLRFSKISKINITHCTCTFVRTNCFLEYFTWQEICEALGESNDVFFTYYNHKHTTGIHIYGMKYECMFLSFN